MAKSLYDEFKVISKINLNQDDIYSLTHLYMPLLGIDSYSLYLGLSTCQDDELYNYKKIIDLLSLKATNSITKAMDKLEGIGLIREYKKDSLTLYKLIRPKTIVEFLKEESLRILLEAEIGQTEIEKLLSKAISDKPSGYKDITKNFSDVFDISTETEETVWNDIFGITKDDLNIKNDTFNYTLFKMYMDTSFLSEEILEEKEFKQNVTRLSKVYKLDENQMVDCIMKSLDIDKDLSYSVLAKNARLIFRESYKVDTPHLVSNTEDEYMDGAKDDELIALSDRLESMSFTDVLENLSHTKASEAEVAMFDELYGESNLSIGAINVMIMMVNREKEGVLPGITYFEKIANTWARAKVKNAYDALKFEQRESNKKKSKQQNSGKKEVKLPSWYDEYKKSIEDSEKKEQENKPSANEDLAQLAKDLFGE